LLADFPREHCVIVFPTQTERIEANEHRGIRADGAEFVLELPMNRINEGDSSIMIAIVRDQTLIQRQNMTTCRVERMVFGNTRLEVGAYLLALWGFAEFTSARLVS